MMIGYIGIALAMFALGVLTLKMIYGTMYTQKDDELLTQAITIADSVHYQDTSDLSEILNRFWQQTDMAEIAGGMIIFDSEGNVRGQSGNFVCITAYEDTKNDILGIARKDGEGSYVINLDEYLTEKDKGNIRLLEKEVTEKKGSLSIDEIAVTKDGDGYRPTRVVFKNRYGKEMLTVTFAKDVSDEMPQIHTDTAYSSGTIRCMTMRAAC
jgi:predicted RNA-binding protein with RPS1 domain